MKLFFYTLTAALLCTSAAFADVARPVLQSSTTKSLNDDLATGAKTLRISATGTLVFTDGFTLTGGSVLKAALSLDNVENTPLSTWAGSANVTTVGTLVSPLNIADDVSAVQVTAGGVVQWSNVAESGFSVTLAVGTPASDVSFSLAGASGTIITTGNLSSINPTGIGQGGATSGQVMAWSGTAWAPTTISSGLTIGSTSISGGTSGRLLTSGATLGELTLGSGVGTWLGTPSLSNLNAAISATLATTGANTFTSTQTIPLIQNATGPVVLMGKSGVQGIVLLQHPDSYLGTSAYLMVGGAGNLNYNGGTFSANSVLYAISPGNSAYYASMEWDGTSAILRTTGSQHIVVNASAGLQMGVNAATTPTAQTIKAHDVTTGTGAALWLTGGTGSAAGGSVVLGASATTGAPVAVVTVTANGKAAIGTTGTPHSKIKSGTAVLASGTVTVSDSDVMETGTAATSSRIFVTRMTDGGTVGSYSITRINATSFSITSTSGSDTSTVSWMMINP